MDDGLNFALIANEARRRNGGRLSKKAQRLYKHMARTDGGVHENRSLGGYTGGYESRPRYSKKAKAFAWLAFWGLFS